MRRSQRLIGVIVAGATVLNLLDAGVSAASASHAPRGHIAIASQPSRAAKTASGKGVASARYVWRDIARLTALHATWAYGWSPWVPASTRSLDVVPMVARAGDAVSTVINHLIAGRKSGAYRELLAFNEPDNRSQANMTPEQAIRLWPKLQSTGLPLGSPAVANVWDGWLDRFMALAAARHYRIDFIALHFYPDFTDPRAPDAITYAVKRVYAKYHRPIWVTEVGAADIRAWGERMRGAPSARQALAFMKAVTSRFAAMPGIVARYAWFSDNSTSDPVTRYGSLYTRSNVLTPLGAAYAAAR